MKRTFILLLFSLFLFTNVLAQTTVSGGIFSDTVWTLAKSPYLVVNDIAVYPGVTLTIEKGVEVLFSKDTKCIVRGTISATGSRNQPIYFKGDIATNSKTYWKGFEVDPLQGGIIFFSHINGSNAKNFISVLETGGQTAIDVKNSKIKNCEIVVVGDDADTQVILKEDSLINNTKVLFSVERMDISKCVFSNGEIALSGFNTQVFATVIVNSKFTNFSKSVIEFQTFEGKVDSCEFTNNHVGFTINSGNVNLSHSYISKNDIGIEIRDFFGSTISSGVTSNQICDNDTFNVRVKGRNSVNLSGNCWCGTISEIDESIYDANDDVELGILTYTPFAKNCELLVNTQNPKLSSTSKLINTVGDIFVVDTKEVFNFNVMSSSGQLIKQGESNRSIDLSELKRGVYFLQVFSDGNMFKEKIIKQ